MAGMLPGVECARRRRFHGGEILSESTPSSSSATARGWMRRSSFCLYTTTKHEIYNPSISYSEQRYVRNKSYGEDDGKLGGAVREAKKRLDIRLRSQRGLEFGRGAINDLVTPPASISKPKFISG